VSLPLELLRQLPLELPQRLALLKQLLAAADPGGDQGAGQGGDPGAVLPLKAELAEVTLRCCEQAYQAHAWAEALEHHDALLALVRQLAAAVPARAEGFWSHYALLLALLTAELHGQVKVGSEAPPPLAERVELCWQLAERLRQAEALPLQPPDWLAVLEQQLVQDGATLSIDLLQEAGQDPAVAAPPATRPRAVRLLARLERLLEPAPEWVLVQARQQLEQQVRLVLEAGPEPEPRALAELAELVELLPVAHDRQPALAAALTRLRLALELLEPQLAPLASPPQAAAPIAEPAVPQPAAPEPASAAGPEPMGPELAELVLLEPGASAGPLQLDLAPLLAAEPEAIEAALDDFVWHLPRGSRALPAATALPALLEPRWRQGLRLPAAALERLAYLAASWQRRLGERLEPLPALDWQHSLLLELGATELAVLQPLLADPAALEPVLAELRREHHNQAFWQQRQELPWMQCPPPLEALRRLHAEEGYYARAHAPLAELAGWGEAAAQALLQAEIWTNDAGCLGRWLAVAQELVLRHGQPLPPLGAPPAPERLLAELGGLEVVYVGERAAGVQAAHRQGLCFRGEPFGLRVVEMPASRWPGRPAGGFGESLALLLEVVDGLYRQRPFALLLADCGAYRLPLLRAAHQRYGVAALSSGRPLAGWLGAG
jgi:hypothetical protein